MSKKLYYVITDNLSTCYFTGYVVYKSNIPCMSNDINKAEKIEDKETAEKIKEQLKGEFKIERIEP